ncbi:hypothetical protein ACFL1R_07475 [Candidatus Latescibacterota bacterium]
MGRNIYENRISTDWQSKIRISIKKTVLAASMLLCAMTLPAYGDSTQFLTTGSARTRALAMGGAYHSLKDDFSAGFYNPGAFQLQATRNERRFRLLFNPQAAAVGLYDYSRYNRDFVEDNKLTPSEVLLSMALLIKGIVYTTPIMDLGIGLGEEVIEYTGQESLSGRMFSVKGLTRSSFHSVFLNLKIASPVSLGMTGTLYNSRTNNSDTYKGGYTFGVLLTPNPKMNVGIVYNKIPDDFSSARLELECIENGAATSGISYYPDDKTVLSIDLRTINKENQATSREIHTGVERRFGRRLALRAGYYRKKTTKHDIISFGIGILPLWEKVSKFYNSTRTDIISYSLIMEENSFKRRWHVLSLLLRF